MPARLDDLAKAHVQALDGVGGVDDAAHLGRKRKKRNHMLPGALPQGRDRRVLDAPRALCKGLQRGPGGRLAWGAVDGLELRGTTRPSWWASGGRWRLESTPARRT